MARVRRENMTREVAIELLQDLHIPEECGMKDAIKLAIDALKCKTPCRLCRFINDKSGICDMCPAMPLERGAE